MSHRDPDDALLLHEAPPGLIERALAEERPSRAPWIAGLVAAAALFGLLAGQLLDRAQEEPTKVVVRAVRSELVEVTFELEAPDARAVAVVGSFNGWDLRADPLERGPDGRFATTVALAPGRHEYLFVVDGAWVLDPAAALTHDDGFGSRNAVLEI